MRKRKRRLTAVMLLCTILILTFSGCSGTASPKDTLLKAMAQTASASSYKVQTTVSINALDLPAVEDKSDSTKVVASALQGSTLHLDAVYQREPARMDVNLQLELAGGGVTLAVPMIITEDKLYIKLPVIPGMALPESAVAKYVEVDLLELASSGDDSQFAGSQTQLQLVRDGLKLFVSSFDDKTYFSMTAAKEAGLPEGVQADEVVTFSIKPENQSDTAAIVTDELLPGLYELLLQNDGYLNALNLTKEQIEQRKSGLAAGSSQLAEKLEKNVSLEQLNLTSAMDDGFLAYQAFAVNGSYEEPETGKSDMLDIHLDSVYSDWNKPVVFDQVLPMDTIKWDELLQIIQPTGEQ